MQLRNARAILILLGTASCDTALPFDPGGTGGGNTASKVGSTATSGQSSVTSTTSQTTGGGDGGSSGSCADGEKLCDGSCVGIEDPSYGCSPSGCDPCAIPHGSATCVASTCVLEACDVLRAVFKPAKPEAIPGTGTAVPVPVPGFVWGLTRLKTGPRTMGPIDHRPEAVAILFRLHTLRLCCAEHRTEAKRARGPSVTNRGGDPKDR
jgi:hypothetical protein